MSVNDLITEGMLLFESNNFDSSNFDYSKTVGEGYHNHSYQRINVVSKEFPFKKTIMAALRSKIEKENAGEVEKILNKATVKVIETALDTIFYQREYVFYNHNLSAQGEAKIAKNKKISFYSVNVTDKSDKKKAELEKYLRDETFKKYTDESGNYHCACCGFTDKSRVPFHVDHIIAMNNGGKSVLENLQILCRSCNYRKSDK